MRDWDRNQYRELKFHRELCMTNPPSRLLVTASDIARRVIANETGQPEHEVEKTDTILAGLVIQYLRRTPLGVL